MDHLFNKPETVSIRYIVSDVKAAVDFYCQLLGFDVTIDSPGGFAMLAKGNLRLLLNSPGAGAAGQAMQDGTEPSPGGWNRMQLQTPAIDAAIEYLKSRNAKFRNELLIGDGGKQILLLDPSGNLIELVEPNAGQTVANRNKTK